MRLSGKIAFVAGASRGIGATVAAALAREGAAVAVAARSEQQGKVPGTIHSVAEGITSSGGRAIALSCDVTSEESVENAIAATVSEFGGIDILIANAGVLWLGPIETTPLKRWQLCLSVNLTGVFLVTKAVIPHLKARGGGSLVAITTTGVDMIEHGSNAYWVSKAGVERLYLGLAADLKADNIAVNCLSPSRVVLTEGWQAAAAAWRSRRRWSNRRRRWPTRPCCWRSRMQAASPGPSSVRKSSPRNSKAAHRRFKTTTPLLLTPRFLFFTFSTPRMRDMRDQCYLFFAISPSTILLKSAVPKDTYSDRLA